MLRLGPATSTGIVIALLCLAAPQADAIELYGSGAAATELGDGAIDLVRAGRGGVRHGGGAHRGGTHRGMNRGGHNRGAYAHRGGFHGANRYAHRNVNRNVGRYGNRNINRNVNRSVHRNVNRNVYRGGVYRGGYYGRWARPGGYWWPVGGAVAAGAAIGFVSAAAAASWAGAAPGPNLCWYYTDPSRRQGFWDACP